MKVKNTLKYVFYFLMLSMSHQAVSQCFEIESLLVAACTAAPNTEGFNEMVRFKVGAAPLNTSNLSVVWANTTNPWQGLIQNAGTAAKVASINAGITAVGGCGQLIEPVGGVLPANAEVILVTSQNFSATANVFGAITQNIYIIFQDNTTVTIGHLTNFNNTPGSLKTLTLSFGACTDSVTYDRYLLSHNQGATVTYTPAGVATYSDPGCVAPVDTFSVDAGTTPVNACPGQTISLSGTAVGYTALAWTAPGGSFSAPGSLATNYTIPASASGSITLTLTATNTCGTNISDTVTVNITASVTPTFNPVPAICSGAAFTPLPTTSINGITGTWSPALSNTSGATYTFTPNAGQCATTATLTTVVNPAVTPAFNSVPAICSGNVLAPLPTTSTNGIMGTWSPALNNTNTTTYTFTPNAGQCASNATLTITVNATNVTPAFNPVPAICPGATFAPLPTTSTNGITGTWSPALSNTSGATYTFTPNSGQCATTATLTTVVNPTVIPTFNPVGSICSGTALSPLPATSTNGITGTWSPALNNTNTTTYTFTPNSGQCASNATLVITVNPNNVLPTFNPVAAICTGSALASLPATSTNGITGTWSPALNNTNTVTYTFTPNAGQCASTTTLTITVNPKVTPTFSAVTPICSGGTLAPLPTTSTNGITGSWLPALNNTYTTTYTFTPDAGQCANTATLTIVVNQGVLPTFSGIAQLICPGDTLAPLPTVSTNGITGTWSPPLNNLMTTLYTFTPDAGQCAVSASLGITVNDGIIPLFDGSVIPAFICYGVTLAPLPTTSMNGITGSWSPALSNTQTETYTFTPDPGQCAVINRLSINVINPVTKNETYFICVNAAGHAITTSTIDSGLSSAQYSFAWSFNGTPIANNTGSNAADAQGTYTLEATNLLTGCVTYTLIAEVKPVIPATATINSNGDFADNQQIITTISGGLGSYEYQLDGGPYQSGNVFNVYNGGEYTVHVKDNLGCNEFTLRITILDYPKFFTPNSDGFNDTWNIAGLPKQNNTQLYIFDRYGKLLKQISPFGTGWDGTYNGREVPATDYWFSLHYSDANGIPKEFKSHFTLKR